MTNEADLPQFHAGPETPIGQIAGMPVAPKKAASSLMKHIMAVAKPMNKVKAKPRKSSPGRMRGRRGIEADSKVHFKTLHKYW